LTTLFAFAIYGFFGFGCLSGGSDCTETVLAQTLPTFVEILLFLVFSIIILSFQHYKNYRIGYLMIVLVPFDIYLFFQILPSIIGMSLAYFLIFLSTSILVALIPFYVLIKLIKQDFFSKKQIAKTN